MAYHLNGGYSGDERESRNGGDDRPDNELTDKPIYLLEHLATFTVNKETGIIYPADGMRRLLQLEKTTGIWSQKMQLCLDYQWVLIMDYETGNVIERFPASLIHEPTAFTSNDPMEMYNNILVFIVNGASGSRSEMHIFQSQGVSAVHLVEDLKQLRSGKLVTQHRETIPAILPQIKSSSLIQHRGVTGVIRSGGIAGLNQNAGEHSYVMSREISGVSGAGGGVAGGSVGHETDSEIGCANDETSSTSSDKYERDVTVLNHCFDDIEKFIARLQHAAAASRELERRRRNRKSKKKDPGEGLLTLRTRPPHEKEFIDIFAKFKLSFNLLAKLKAHIHDPNAPELVHFLFTPLALIVEASSDTYFESQLPQRVINPLLTREAINLLINCVTSKETELWRSLGEAWTVPRDQWKEDVGSYHPVFLDGWSPDYLVIDELDHLSTPTNVKRRTESNHNFENAGRMNESGVLMGGDYDYDSPPGSGLVNEKYALHHLNHGGDGIGGVDRSDRDRDRDRDRDLKDFSARSDISLDSIERNGVTSAPIGPLNNSPLAMRNGAHSLHLSSAQNAAVQSITGGMQNLYSRGGQAGGLNAAGSSVGGDGVGASGTTRAGASSGNVGVHNDDQVEAWLDELQASGAKIVLVTYPKTANNDKELSVVRGEYLEILDDSRQWWKARNSRGQVAHVPHTLVIPYNYNENEFNNQFYTQHFKSNTRQSTDLKPQVGGAQHHQNSTDWVRNKHIEIVDSKDVHESPVRYAVPTNRGRLTTPPLQRVYCSTAGGFSNFYEFTMPLQPPPPPPPPPLPAPGFSNKKSNNSHAHSSQTIVKNTNTESVPLASLPNDGIPLTDVMQKELKQVLRSRERRDLDILKTPQVYIDQTSSPTEVERWLKAKEFSDTIIKRLHGFSGGDLLTLQPEKMENYFGFKEGRRLASQVMLQKSVSGYKTARTTELQAVLARARPKSDN